MKSNQLILYKTYLILIYLFPISNIGPVTTSAVEKALEDYRSIQNEPLRIGRRFNRSTQEAQEVRNKFKEFFNGSGAVAWQ